MKMLTSRWGIALIAALSYLGTSTLVLLQSFPKPRPGPPDPTAKPPKIWNFKTDAVDEMITELQAERARFVEEQKSVETLRTQLGSERAELEHLRDEIKTLRDELDLRVVKIQESDLKNLKTLATQYSAMKPVIAVSLFQEMEEDMVVRILGLMKPDRITAVLEEMSKLRERAGDEPTPRRMVRLMDKLRLLQTPKKETTS